MLHNSCKVTYFNTKKMESQNINVMKDLQGYFKAGQRKAIYNNCKNLRDKVLVRILWKTGRRISEVLMLKVGYIDFDNKMILWNILKKKQSMQKWKPLDEFSMKLLINYIERAKLFHEDYYIFHSGHPLKHMSRQHADRIIKKAARKAGIYRVGTTYPHAHHFRHSFCIDMAKKLKSPADIRKLQMLMEHNNLGITETYLQFGDLELRDLVEDGARNFDE